MKGGIVFLFFVLCLSLVQIANAQVNFETLRSDMVKTQIVDRGISNRYVINAIRKVERHLFVPEEVRSLAYNDHPLVIGEGQTISQPYIVALMTELLKLDKQSKVLEIGTGSGYQAAILGEIAAEVYTIEIFESLHLRSKKLLDRLGYQNIHCMYGDGYEGWKAHAPYDAIIVTCAPSEIPEPLVEQLDEGGRMLIPVGKQFVQELVMLRKKNGKLKRTNVAQVLFVPMLKQSGGRYD